MAEREVERWITVNGVHIPVYKGESSDDAVSRVKGNISKANGNSERVGKQALADASIGARLEDSNGDVWRKTNSGNNGMLPWHKEYSTDKASNDYLAQSKDIKSSKFITPAKKGEDFPHGKSLSSSAHTTKMVDNFIKSRVWKKAEGSNQEQSEIPAKAISGMTNEQMLKILNTNSKYEYDIVKDTVKKGAMTVTHYYLVREK